MRMARGKIGAKKKHIVKAKLAVFTFTSLLNGAELSVVKLCSHPWMCTLRGNDRQLPLSFEPDCKITFLFCWLCLVERYKDVSVNATKKSRRKFKIYCSGLSGLDWFHNNSVAEYRMLWGMRDFKDI